jgi:glycosyltransferase family protein
MMFCKKDAVGEYFGNIKKIWDNKDILLIEGEKSRLGVGNDLFDNVHSIKRILAPNTEAWDYYNDIVKEVGKYNPKEYLILLALGPTATIMAYDLAIKGYQTIDIGHIDIEYEWYKMGAEKKVPVANKFVNEAGGGAGVGDIIDNKYKTEIVCQF